MAGEMKTLPVPARIYVASIIGLGATLLLTLRPLKTLDSPILFIALLILSCITSVYKVHLPLARSGSTMSVSYAVDFLSLILLGPGPTMIVGAISAWSQCTFRTTIKTSGPRSRRCSGAASSSRWSDRSSLR